MNPLLHMKHIPLGRAEPVYVNWHMEDPGFRPDRHSAGALPDTPATELIFRFLEKTARHFTEKRGRRLCFELFGYEITRHRDIFAVVEWIEARGGSCSIVSNLRVEPNFWRNDGRRFKHVILEFNSEACTEDRLLETLAAFGGETAAAVKIMLTPGDFERQLAIGRWAGAAFPAIPFAFHPYFWNVREAKNLSPYSESQAAAFREAVAGQRTAEGDEPRALLKGSMACRFLDRTSLELTPLSLIVRDLNHWKGWICWSGVEQFVVTYRGDVFGAWCAQNWLGNLTHDNVKFSDYPVFCAKEICLVESDIAVRRQCFENASAPAVLSAAGARAKIALQHAAVRLSPH